jgi:hypothetical protein
VRYDFSLRVQDILDKLQPHMLVMGN